MGIDTALLHLPPSLSAREVQEDCPGSETDQEFPTLVPACHNIALAVESNLRKNESRGFAVPRSSIGLLQQYSKANNVFH